MYTPPHQKREPAPAAALKARGASTETSIRRSHSSPGRRFRSGIGKHRAGNVLHCASRVPVRSQRRLLRELRHVRNPGRQHLIPVRTNQRNGLLSVRSTRAATVLEPSKVPKSPFRERSTRSTPPGERATTASPGQGRLWSSSLSPLGPRHSQRASLDLSDSTGPRRVENDP